MIRATPSAPRHETSPSGPSCASPILTEPAAVFARDEGDEASLVRDMERIEAKEFTSCPHVSAHANARLKLHSLYLHLPAAAPLGNEEAIG